MLGLILDAAVLVFVIRTFQGDDAADFLGCFWIALGMAAANFAISLLAPVIGLFILLPILVADGAILMLFASLTPKQTAIALGILVAYQVALYAAFAWLFS
jgi:hypothetical protein